MYEAISRLMLYGDVEEDSILGSLGRLYWDWEAGVDQTLLRHRMLTQGRRLLEIADRWGFDGDLWAAYVTLRLVSSENPYTLAAERREVADGTLKQLAVMEMGAIGTLLHMDFHPLEIELEAAGMAHLRHYQVSGNGGRLAAGRRIQTLRDQLLAAKTASEMLEVLSGFYRRWGAGRFALASAFRIEAGMDGIAFQPVEGADQAALDDLIGYDWQKKALRENTEAFLQERPANHVLLYGDAGTGKSTCVKALLREYQERGLRMIELYKHQFALLPDLMAALRERNCRFLLLIDDLSFEENEVAYKFLKAVIEGGVETCPENVRIYATSNRRHLIRETWGDRADMEYHEDIHHSDTMQEKLSLAARFGIAINFDSPSRQAYHAIVQGLAARCPEITLSKEELLLQADRWELRHGGPSGRTAQQFIQYLAGLD